MHKPALIFLGICFLLSGIIPVQAQTGARLSLYSLQSAAYPVMTAGLDVFDSGGNFVTGLTAASITLLEDNQPRTVDILEEKQPGVMFALALDPSPLFGYRDNSGVSRYTKMEQILKDWAAAHPDSLTDDISLIPTEGTPTTHMTTATAFSDALVAYSPILRTITPSLSTLSLALDAVTEQPPQMGMKKLVLFITSVPSQDAILTLQSLGQRALSEDVRVVVWIIDSQDAFETNAGNALKDLATQTGGQYLLFSGEEPLPSLETYLTPLRHTYQLSYTSGVITPGGHTLTAQVNVNGETISSAAVPFELDIQPPNPILVLPPEQIVRQPPDIKTTDPAVFPPTEQVINIIVEFPDQRQRPLTRTALLVDGQVVAENTSEPFDQFTWDISGYATSGEHSLSVEAVDSLGLSKTSIEVPVTITVIQPKTGLVPWLSRNNHWLVVIAILAAGVVLALVLAGGRLLTRYQAFAGGTGRRASTRQATMDPLTQPIEGEKSRHGVHMPWSRPEKPPEAYLVRLKGDGQPVTSPPIPIVSPEMTFGSDPIQATRVLDDPSVSPLHARMKVENGEFILSDEKSVAGTWVNYLALTQPQVLKHGDVLQIGRFSYRFMLRVPPEIPDPKIEPGEK